MGAGSGGGPSIKGPSLQANIARLQHKFTFSNKAGKFGVSGSGRARVIVSENPKATARQFFESLSIGSVKTKGAGWELGKFSDGSAVFFRPISKSGGPAVNIKVKGSKPIRYKVHFEQTGWVNQGDKK